MVFAGDLTATADRNSVVTEIDKLVASTSNVKVYDEQTKTATIKNPTGTTILANIKLLTPLNNLVGLGYQKVAEFEIDSKVSYTDFLKQMYFFDVKNKNAGIRRGFDLKKEVIKQVEEPMYELVDTGKLDNNGDKLFDNKIVSSKFVGVTSYELLTEKNFGVEKQVVSMWVQIDKAETVEWIPELYGAIVNEWATWTSALDTNLIAYYKLDETSGVLIDWVGKDNNLNNTNVDYNQTGLINTSYLYDGSDKSTREDSLGLTSTGLKSVSMWIKLNSITLEEYGFVAGLGYVGTTANTGWFLYTPPKAGGQVLALGTNGNHTNVIAKLSDLGTTNWHHIVFDYNGTASKAYLDGVYNSTLVFNSAWIQYFYLGSPIGGTSNFYIDEVGVWNRVLTPTEVTQLYNSGAGIAYGAYPPQSRITWNVYKSATTTHISDVNIDCNNNSMDATLQDSPFSSAYVDVNTSVLCSFSAVGYDLNSNYAVTVDSNKTVTVYLNENPPPVRITWNVFRNGSSSHLTGFSADCNVNAMDLTTQNSPYSSAYVNSGTSFSCNFTRTGYDANNAYTGVVDANKTLTVYLIDSTAPSVGQTYQTGFNLYSTTYITGTGNIYATASDAGSGLASCSYTQNGSSWLSADVNATHCYKNGLTIVNAQTYQFNFKATDVAGNDSNGTKIATLFTGDTLAPVTTVVLTDYNNSPYKFIHATCIDAGSGCKSITFEFDNNGTKFLTAGATKDLNFYGLGYHSLKVYSTDNLDTNEVTQTIDLNMPVKLTIKYPKNIATLAQLTEKWTLLTAGAITLSLTDLTSDYNIYVPNGSLTTFYISDVNGNYTQNIYTRTYYNDSNTGYDTLQPYLYAVATSLATVINTIDSTTLNPVPNITIKIYGNLAGIGNTLIGQGTTDSKGQMLQLFIIGQTYQFEIYKNGNLLRTDIIIASSSSVDIKIPSSTTQHTNFDYYLVNISNTPVRGKLLTSDYNFWQIITLLNSGTDTTTITSIWVWVENEDRDFNFYSSSVAPTGLSTSNHVDMNALAKTINAISYDGNYFIYVNTRVVTSDGNVIVRTVKFGLPNTYSITEGFGNGLKATFGCPVNPDPLFPCGPMLLAALFLALIGTIGLASLTGYASMESMAIVFLAFLGIFAYLTWVPALLYGLMIILTVVLGIAMGGNRV